MPRKRKKAAMRPGRSPAMAAVMEYLKAHPKAEYREVAEAVGKNGHKIFPVVYGRAQALLGIVRAKARTRGERGMQTAVIPVAPPRPRTLKASTESISFAELLASCDGIRGQVEALRAAIEAKAAAIGKEAG